MYAAIRADLLISNALFELIYVLMYVLCRIFVTRAHDCLAPYIQILATPLVRTARVVARRPASGKMASGGGACDRGGAEAVAARPAMSRRRQLRQCKRQLGEGAAARQGAAARRPSHLRGAAARARRSHGPVRACARRDRRWMPPAGILRRVGGGPTG